MGFLRSICRIMFPWILYAVLTSELGVPLKYALLISLSYTLCTNYNSLRKKQIVSWITLLCFAVLLIGSFSKHNFYVEKNPWVVSNFVLTLIAFGSVIFQKPFTMQYAREFVSKEKWQHPLFFQINLRLSMAWGLIFFITFLCHVLIICKHELHFYLRFIIYGLIFLGVLFTVRYPSICREKYRRQQVIASSL